MLRLAVLLSCFLYARADLAYSKAECKPSSENYHAESNSCYVIPLGVLEFWNGGQTYCQSKGGDLASIPSQSAQDFIEGVIAKQNPEAKDNALFINLNSVGTGGYWGDGETSKYRHWLGKYPPYSQSSPVGCMLVKSRDGNTSGLYHWTNCYPNWKMEFLCRFKL